MTKTYKTFLATYRPVGRRASTRSVGRRVVLVKEERGSDAFFCTDLDVSVKEILEAFADQATIEQDFHDVKELWAWHRPAQELRTRSASPWDDDARRPSHTDRHKALRNQLSILTTNNSLLQKMEASQAHYWRPRRSVAVVFRKCRLKIGG